MDLHVRFHFDKNSQAVEFLVEAEGDGLPEDLHNQQHDRLAAELGRLLERLPQVTEVPPGLAATPRPAATIPGEMARQEMARQEMAGEEPVARERSTAVVGRGGG